MFPQKSLLTFNGLHCVISQKKGLFLLKVLMRYYFRFNDSKCYQYGIILTAGLNAAM
jgi:hypothetical protein